MENTAHLDDKDRQFRLDIVALTPKLRSLAFSLCQNATEAEDLVQDTLLKAWSRRSQFQEGTVLRAWMFTILRHRFLDGRRKSWRECVLDPEFAENALYAVSDPDKALELDELRRALATLDVEQREAVILVGAGGLAYDEAARVCGSKTGTMKSRTSRGRVRLQAILDAGDYEADGERCEVAMSMIMAQVSQIVSRQPAHA